MASRERIGPSTNQSRIRRMNLLPRSAAPSVGLLLISRSLRAFGDGLVSLLLPVYLALIGFSAFEIGLLVTATLAGSSILTLSVGCSAIISPAVRS